MPWGRGSACAIALIGAQSALGHPHAALADCLGFDDPGRRLACFEQAAAPDGGGREPERPPPTAMAKDAPTPAPKPGRTMPPVAAKPESGPASPTAAPAPGKVLESTAPQNPAASGDVVTVVRVTAPPGQPIIFRFASGEVWQQTRQRMTNLPEPPFKAAVSRGAFGSHRLRVTPRSPAIGIRRVRQQASPPRQRTLHKRTLSLAAKVHAVRAQKTSERDPRNRCGVSRSETPCQN